MHRRRRCRGRPAPAVRSTGVLVSALALVESACALGGGSVGGEGAPSGAGSGAAGGSPAAAEASADRLAVCEVGRTHLVVEDGTVLYIEAEELIELASGLLVVGTPTYAWLPGAGPSEERVVPDAHLAAVFDLEGRARGIEKPIPGTIGSIKATALGGDRWGVVFAEIHPDSLPGKEFLIDAWYAEHDGARWALVERLPAPARGTLSFAADSELVRWGDRLSWVATTRLPIGLSELVLYERRDGAWSVRQISDDWVEVSTLAYDPREQALWLAQFSEDPEIPEWQQSLRLYRSERGGAWELVSRLAVVERNVKVREPRVRVLSDGVAVAWLTFGATLEAWARVGIRRDHPGSEIRLDPSAFQILSLGELGGHPAWLLNHLIDGGRAGELTVVRLPRSRPGVVESSGVPNPYPSFFATLPLGADEVVVVGPEVDRDPAEPTVRSLVLRLSTSCT